MTRQSYTQTVLDLYVHLPGMTARLCAQDRRLAQQWFDRQVPLALIETALYLGVCRRLYRDSGAVKLAPIRSMAYFQPIVEELMAQPPPASYIGYLRQKLEATQATG
jgi:hypothetical protein